MRLTDEQVKELPIKKDFYKIHFGRRLYLYVMPNGKKIWYFFYNVYHKKKMMELGEWPKVKVLTAWRRAQKARIETLNSSDPNARGKFVVNAFLSDEIKKVMARYKKLFEKKFPDYEAVIKVKKR